MKSIKIFICSAFITTCAFFAGLFRSEPKPVNTADIRQYRECVSDLLCNEKVKSMAEFIQHSDVTCLEHCLLVSYYSFLVCRFFRLDFRSAARGALLHDLFLYDWHKKCPVKGLHAFTHPTTALKNCRGIALNEKEKDIIKKHMWPLTVVPPKYRESFVVSCVDKYCAVVEASRILKPKIPELLVP